MQRLTACDCWSGCAVVERPAPRPDEVCLRALLLLASEQQADAVASNLENVNGDEDSPFRSLVALHPRQPLASIPRKRRHDAGCAPGGHQPGRGLAGQQRVRLAPLWTTRRPARPANAVSPGPDPRPLRGYSGTTGEFCRRRARGVRTGHGFRYVGDRTGRRGSRRDLAHDPTHSSAWPALAACPEADPTDLPECNHCNGCQDANRQTRYCLGFDPDWFLPALRLRSGGRSTTPWSRQRNQCRTGWLSSIKCDCSTWGRPECLSGLPEPKADMEHDLELLGQFRPDLVTTGGPADRLPADPEAEDPLPPARHSKDFRSVHWYGTNHCFTEAQAAVVAHAVGGVGERHPGSWTPTPARVGEVEQRPTARRVQSKRTVSPCLGDYDSEQRGLKGFRDSARRQPEFPEFPPENTTLRTKAFGVVQATMG